MGGQILQGVSFPMRHVWGEGRGGSKKQRVRSEQKVLGSIKKTPHTFYLSVASLGGLGVINGAVLPELVGEWSSPAGVGALSPLPEVKPSSASSLPSPVTADR